MSEETAVVELSAIPMQRTSGRVGALPSCADAFQVVTRSGSSGIGAIATLSPSIKDHCPELGSQTK